MIKVSCDSAGVNLFFATWLAFHDQFLISYYSHVVELLSRFGRSVIRPDRKCRLDSISQRIAVSGDTRTMEQANGNRKVKRDLVLWRCRYLVGSKKRGPSIYLVSNEGTIGGWRTWQRLGRSARLDLVDLFSNRSTEVKHKGNLCVLT